MVCQAASQTRFRALKHENGIVVRVIACFQPLQDCQVIVGFIWMFKANTPWHSSSQHSYRQLPDLNHMTTLLENRQQECLPSLSNLGIRKCSVPLPLQNSRTQQTNEANDWLHGFPSDFRALIPSPNPFLEGKKSQFPLGLDGMVVPPNQKGLLIFDQSEDQTRLIYNYFCPTSQIPGTANVKLVSGHNEKLPRMDQIDSTKKVTMHGASDTSDKSEMHEDTEEINALLDSDDESGNDDDDDKCDDEDDEVTSTCRSPVKTRKGPEKQESISLDELLEEVASSDGPNKRQKKLDGGYFISSSLSTASSVNFDGSHEYENDAKSYCTFGKSRSKKDKIREILVVLESIIPGVKGKDPLLVIDEAIDYLRIAKNKAETLGVSFH